MKEISNKVLMYVLFVAIVVSVGSTMFSLGKIAQAPSYTGMATHGKGNVTVVVDSTQTVNLTDFEIDFGTVELGGGYTNCLLNSSDGNEYPTGCDGATYGAGADTMAFQNIGSATIDVEVTGNDAATFIGGSSPAFEGLCTCTVGTAGIMFDPSAGSDCCDGLTVTQTGTFAALVNISSGATGSKTNELTFTATAD